MLDGDLLLAAGAVALKRFQLGRECPGELVESTLGAILLLYGLALANRGAMVIIAMCTAAICAASIATS